MQRRSFIPTAVSVLALGVLACGDDGGDKNAGKSAGADDKAEIARVIKLAFTTQDEKVSCEQVSSRSFVGRVYGDVAQCLKAEKPKPDDKPPTEVRASSIIVNGDGASARTQFIGGDFDGVAGTVEVRKESGTWRIDDLGADLLRSVLRRGLASELKDDEAFRQPKIRACVTTLITDLPDDKLKRVAYASIGEREGADEQFGKLLAPCLTQAGSGEGAGGQSIVREKFEHAIKRSLRQTGLPDSAIECISKRLRSSISDDELGALTTNEGQPTAKMRRSIAAAIRACGRSGTGSTTQ